MMHSHEYDSYVFDVHSHIIPVDDGANNLEEALDTVRRSYAQGVRWMIATPHSFAFERDAGYVGAIYTKLKAIVAKELPDMRIGLGCEVLCSVERMDNVLGGLDSGILPSMCETNIVMAEFRTETPADEIEYCIDTLQKTGRVPMIAHIERYGSLFDHWEMLRRLHESGVLFQVNAYSLVDEPDDTIRNRANDLLRERMIDFLGSDTHGMCHRPPMWGNALRLIETSCGDNYLRSIGIGNAKRYFEGKMMNTNEAMFARNVFLDGMLGLAVGDALGVPYEAKTRAEMHDHPAVDMVGYGSHNQPEGTWSDDTSMALCIADSLCRRYDPDDIMKKFMEWKRYEKYTATGVRFDIGRQTRRAITRYEKGLEAVCCGDASENGNGNGGLMRTLPISLYQLFKQGEDEAAIESVLSGVHDVSSLTHAHEYGLISCGIFTMILREWLFFRRESDNIPDVCERGFKKAEEAYLGMGGRFEAAMKTPGLFIRPHDLMNCPEGRIESDGYALNTLHSSLWCLLKTDSFRNAVLMAVNMGGDTDTTAAVTGALAGVIYGRDAIPWDWLDKLKRREFIETICDALNRTIREPERNAVKHGIVFVKHQKRGQPCGYPLEMKQIILRLFTDRLYPAASYETIPII